MPVSCEEVRELLPEYADPGPRAAGEVELHVASCPRCSAELASYRDMLGSLAALRLVEEEPPAGYLERTLRLVRARGRRLVPAAHWRAVPGRALEIVKEPRVAVAVASVAGLALGATAVGLVWWRAGRRATTLAAAAQGLLS